MRIGTETSPNSITIIVVVWNSGIVLVGEVEAVEDGVLEGGLSGVTVGVPDCVWIGFDVGA